MFGWFRRRREAKKQEAVVMQQATERKNAFVEANRDRVDNLWTTPLLLTPAPYNPNNAYKAREINNLSYENERLRRQVEDKQLSNSLLTTLAVEEAMVPSVIESVAYEPTPSYDPGPNYDPAPSVDYSSSFDSGSSGGAGGGSDW